MTNSIESILQSSDFFITSIHTVIIATLLTISIIFYRHFTASHRRSQLADSTSTIHVQEVVDTTTDTDALPPRRSRFDPLTESNHELDLTERTSEFLKRSSTMAESLKSAINVPSTDPNTGRRLRKRERALILAQKLMRLKKPQETFVEKSLPNFYLEHDENVPVGINPEADKRRQSSMFPKEIAYLQKSIKVFGYLESDLLMKLVTQMEPVELHIDEHLFREGDPDVYLYIVREGEISIHLKDEAGRIEVDTRKPGDSIQSLLSVLDMLVGLPDPRLKTVSAKATKERTVVLRLPVQTLCDECNKNMETMTRLIQMICLRLQRVSLFTLNQYLGLGSELLRTEELTQNLNTSDLESTKKEFQQKLPEYLRKPTHRAGNRNYERNYDQQETPKAVELPEIHQSVLSDVQKLLGIRNRELLESMTTLLTIPPKYNLLECQSYDTKFYYVVSGKLVGYQDYGNGAIPLFTAKAGSTCGGLSMLTGEPSFYSLKSQTTCLVLRILQADFHKLVEQEPSIVINCAKTVTSMISPFVRQVDFLLDWTTLESGSPLYKQGEIASNSYIVLNGRLRSVIQLESKEPGRSESRNGDGRDKNRDNNTRSNSNRRTRNRDTNQNINDKFEKKIHAEYGRGEFVGLQEVVKNGLRPTSIHAVRDTELAKIPMGLLSYIRFKYRGVTSRLMALLHDVKPLTDIESDKFIQGQNLNTIAIIGSTDDTPVDIFSILLQHAINSQSTEGENDVHHDDRKMKFGHSRGHSLGDFTPRVARLTSRNVKQKLGNLALDSNQDYRLHSWLSQQEENHRLVLYQCDNAWTPWTKRCIRQADAILILAKASNGPKPGKLEEILECSGSTTRALKMLCILHDVKTIQPEKTVEYLNQRRFLSHHFHLKIQDEVFELSRFWNDFSKKRETLTKDELNHRGKLRKTFVENQKTSKIDKHSDIARLSRFLTGTQIAIVFGGGGSRGFCHAALVSRIRDELDIPIDLVGGTSIGSVAAAHFALTKNCAKVREGLKIWADGMGSSSLMAADLTMPVTSIFSGKIYNNALEQTFGEVQIEDLWLPCFFVTTNISTSKIRIHKHGSVWRYVRASSSYTPYLPPVCDPVDGNLLLDGCYVNNLPADIAREEFGACRVIALDVIGPAIANYEDYGEWLSGTWFTYRRILHWFGLSNYRPRIPKMGEISLRLSQILGEHLLEKLKKESYCLYYKLPVDNYSVSDFKKFDEIDGVGVTYANSVFTTGWKKQLENEINDILLTAGPRGINVLKMLNKPNQMVKLTQMQRKTLFDQENKLHEAESCGNFSEAGSVPECDGGVNNSESGARVSGLNSKVSRSSMFFDCEDGHDFNDMFSRSLSKTSSIQQRISAMESFPGKIELHVETDLKPGLRKSITIDTFGNVDLSELTEIYNDRMNDTFTSEPRSVESYDNEFRSDEETHENQT